MPGSGSDAARTRFVACVLAAWLACGAGFYLFQAYAKPVGGDIAPVKAWWLAYAVLYWMVLPFLIATDRRLEWASRRPFAALAMLMVVRAIVEGWMLYVTFGWSPWYGIAHDALCVAALVALAPRDWFAGVVTSRVTALLRVHLAFTGLLFLPEIWFAWYMLTNFSTKGEGAIYFVPDEPAHALALNVTTAVVVCSTAYLLVFLERWLHATPERDRAAAIVDHRQ